MLYERESQRADYQHDTDGQQPQAKVAFGWSLPLTLWSPPTRRDASHRVPPDPTATGTTLAGPDCSYRSFSHIESWERQQC